MPKPAETTISSLEQYVGFVEELPAGPHWFRGCGQATLPLLPTLYRHKERASFDERLKLEGELLTWFQQRSAAYLERDLPDEEWEHLFFMQHFGVPTRLLDWTESALIGLYFALTGQKDAEGRPAVVWVLEPEAWNTHALRNTNKGSDVGVLSPQDGLARGYAPRGRAGKLDKEPVAMYGTHNSRRIAAQKGAFTVFGDDMTPMEDIFEEEGYPAEALARIAIADGDRYSLLEALRRAGITDSAVFPDLAGLAMEAKRQFGFEV
jgi:hypothetical protein